jgi:hypothetical protein
MSQPKSRPPTEFAAVVAEVSALVGSLRRALREALDHAMPELNGARACGRALGLKRDLGWKVYAIATTDDATTVLRLLPRRTGWNLVLKGLRGAGCSPGRIRTLEAAIDSIVQRLDAASVDRALLRAVAAGGLDSSRESLAMVRGRNAARKANEEIYGVRAESFLGVFLVGPPDPHGHIDLFSFGQFDGLRRLRPGPAVPVHHSMQVWQPEWKGLRAGEGVGTVAALPSLVADLSDPEIGAGLLRAVARPTGTVLEYLGDGSEPPRGHRAVFADFMPKGGTLGPDVDPAEFKIVIDLPIANALLEVWLHRSIRRHSEPAAALLGSFGRVPVLGEQVDFMRLPLETSAQAITRPSLPLPFARGRRTHHEMVARAAAAVAQPVSEFEGFRVVVPDPPIGSHVALRWRM